MKGLRAFCEWLQVIALGTWVGGMFLMGALVARVAFGTLPRNLAGALMARMFVVFNGPVTYTCLVLISLGFVGSALIERRAPSAPPRRMKVAGTLLILMAAVAGYVGAVLTPEMEALRAAGFHDPAVAGEQAKQFVAYHRLSVILFTVNMLLGAALLYIKAWALAAHPPLPLREREGVRGER